MTEQLKEFLGDNPEVKNELRRTLDNLGPQTLNVRIKAAPIIQDCLRAMDAGRVRKSASSVADSVLLLVLWDALLEIEKQKGAK